MRLIDADELEKRIWKVRRQYQLMDDTQTADVIMHGIYRVEQVLDEIPTIDAEPVKHAHWIFHPKDERERRCTLSSCSYCGAESLTCGDYCSHCGAKMDEEEE